FPVLSHLLISVPPVGGPRNHEFTGPLPVDIWRVDTNRRLAMLFQSTGHRHELTSRPDDELVRRTEVLGGAVVDLAHRFGNRAVLDANTGDARVALAVALSLAVDLEVVRQVLVAQEAVVPAGAVRQAAGAEGRIHARVAT